MTDSPELELRKIQLAEYPACASIYADAWNSALPDYLRIIGVDAFAAETEGELTLVATLGDCIQGYISIWQPDWFVHHLYVDPAAQGAGIGRALLARAQRFAGSSRLSLKCQVANTKALGFYTAMGFVETAERGSDQYGPWIQLKKTSVTANR